MRQSANDPRRWLLGAALATLLAAVTAQPALAEEYVGLVHPNHELTLSMGIGGVVSRVHVKHGQLVKANQGLLQLDDRMQAIEADRRRIVFEDASEINAVEDRVRALKRMHTDTRAVFEKTGSISRDEMDKLDVEYSTARGRLEQLQTQKRRERLEYDAALQEREMRRLTAPVSGVITRIHSKAGEWAKPGEPMIALVDASTCYLTANVPLRSVHGLKPGMTLPVRFESAANAAPVEGKISFVSTVADPASGLVELRVTFANPGQRIRPGIKGMIDIPPS